MAGRVSRAYPTQPPHRGGSGEIMVPPPVHTVIRTAYRGDEVARDARVIPEETPIALTYNRSAYAVMLATPSDLPDFALGFSLTEGIVQRPAEIEELDIVRAELGIELRMWLAPERADRISL